MRVIPDAGEAQRSARDRRWLPVATALALGIGALLRFHVLLTPLHSDDHQQLAMLHGHYVLERAPWDLFWFGPRTQAERSALLDFGFDPWWTASTHQISMFRPLSSLLIAFDDRVLGANALACHAHSLLWWALLVLASGRLLSRLLPDAVAACALLLFALDSAHNVPLAWLANRSTLVAATFGVLALGAHVRARSGDGAHAARAWSLLWWACAFAAGEYAAGMLAYLIAYEAFGARGALRERVAALLPALGIAAVYVALRSLLGYGVGGSGIYVGPGEPLRFALAAAGRIPALASDLLLGVPASWWQGGSALRNALLSLDLFSLKAWHALPGMRSVQVASGLCAIAASAFALHRYARTAPPEQQPTVRAVRWLAAGSLLALLAASGAVPSPRLLVASALGGSALLGGAFVYAVSALLASGARLRPGLRQKVAFASLAIAIAFVHGALAARAAYADTLHTERQARTSRAWALNAPIPHASSTLDLVIISASDFATAVNVPWLRASYGLPVPHSYRRLSGAMQAHDVTRIDSHTLELMVLSHDVSDAFAGSLYRPRSEPLRVGQRVRVPGLSVTVLAVDRGNPWRLRVRFDRELDDPQLLFLHARPHGLERIRMPAQGQTLRLPRAAVPWQLEAD